ncbi:uncharacterized protein LOC124155871 [Ischnura elegans]|uniref:uncharacterized protein LOC124155871 n=1 Tax=Ischnura elegans TaxID=197161 RepID=UPI001ED89D2F|nr:uncharacterized protein LOC124155871 [Ischnura elegans]
MGRFTGLLLMLLGVLQGVAPASFVGTFGGVNDVDSRRSEVSHRGPPHVVSPCPDVLIGVTNNNKTNRWYGVVSFPVVEPINGIDLSIRLDKRADMLGTWLGEVFTDDKTYFSIIDDQVKVLPGEIFAVRFFVKYNPSEGEPPRVKTITFNGRLICPQNKESLQPKDSAESDSSPFVSSETTQSVTVDHGASISPRLSAQVPLTTQPPRHSRGDDSSQHEKPQLEQSQAASMLVNLLRRLARIRNAPNDQEQSIAFEELQDGSFGRRGENARGLRVETLEGLLTTLLRLLTTDEERNLDLGIPNPRHYDAEVENVATTPSTAFLVNEAVLTDRIAPVEASVNEEANRVPHKDEDVGVGRPFKPRDPETYYDEVEYGDDGLALFVSTPRNLPQSPPQSSTTSPDTEQTTTLPTTLAEDTSPSSSEFGSTLGVGNFETYGPQDTEAYGDDAKAEESDGVTTARSWTETDQPQTRFVTDRPETTLPTETPAPTTTVEPTTIVDSDEINAVFGEREVAKVESAATADDPRRMTTPCPGVFSYFSHLAGDDVWYGNITLNSDEDLVGLRVDLELDKRAQGIGALLGNVSTRDNIHFTVWNSTARIDPGESIYVYFFVKYDPRETVPPRIQTIRLNGMQICSTREVEAPSTPSTVKRPTVLPVVGKRRPLPNERIIFRTTSNNLQYEQLSRTADFAANSPREENRVEQVPDIIHNHVPQHTTLIITTEHTTEPVTASQSSLYTTEKNLPTFAYKKKVETVVNILPADPNTNIVQRKNGLEEAADVEIQQQEPIINPNATAEKGIVGGDDATCGQKSSKPSISSGKTRAKEWWPWHAAIYEINGESLYYLCGGTILGQRTVLTAARCLSNEETNEVFSPKSLAVYVGKYNLNRWDEAVKYQQVEEVHLHPDFDWKNIHGDLAVLKLASAIEFSDFVQPVCLGKPAEPDSEEGVVVGWGFDRHGNVSEELTTSRMPLLTMRTCSSRYPKLLNYALSDRIYCAGYKSRTTMCSGEMGDGMYYSTNGETGHDLTKWTIRGIASFTLSRKRELGCSDRNYVVFTDVTKYHEWLGKYR